MNLLACQATACVLHLHVTTRWIIAACNASTLNLEGWMGMSWHSPFQTYAAGLALPAGQHPDLNPSRVVERPRVLYNEGTQRFVMWMHIDTADYELASCGMATSTAPTGRPPHDSFILPSTPLPRTTPSGAPFQRHEHHRPLT